MILTTGFRTGAHHQHHQSHLLVGRYSMGHSRVAAAVAACHLGVVVVHHRIHPGLHCYQNRLLAAPLVEAGVPESRVHRLAGPRQATGLEQATALMIQDLAEHGLDQGAFDVIHLGLGPDAHICSLFSGHPAALTTGMAAVAVDHSPKPPPQRCSLTFEAIQRAATVMVVAGGAGKARAVSAGLGSPDAVAAPASCARGAVTTWYLDAAAAAGAPD